MATNKIDMSIEIWKPVVGYEPLYEVSNFGSVRKLESKELVGVHQRNEYGHLSVWLIDGTRKRQAMLHHVVLEAFVGPRPEGMVGCHEPEQNPKNNRLDNLRWDTQSHNLKDRANWSASKTSDKQVSWFSFRANNPEDQKLVDLLREEAQRLNKPISYLLRKMLRHRYDA